MRDVVFLMFIVLAPIVEAFRSGQQTLEQQTVGQQRETKKQKGRPKNPLMGRRHAQRRVKRFRLRLVQEGISSIDAPARHHQTTRHRHVTRRPTPSGDSSGYSLGFSCRPPGQRRGAVGE